MADGHYEVLIYTNTITEAVVIIYNGVMDLFSKVMKRLYLYYIILNDHSIELLYFYHHESSSVYFFTSTVHCFGRFFRKVIRTNLLDLRTIGTSTVGLSDYWVFGLLGIWTIGPSDYRAFRLLGLRTIGPSDYWAFELLDHRTIEGPIVRRPDSPKAQ